MTFLSRNLAKLGSIDAIKEQNTGTTATFSYLDAGGEQTIFELSTARIVIKGIWFDTSNMAQNGTIKVYYKVDGTNYRQVNALDAAITGGTTECIYINLSSAGITSDFKVTYTEGGDEGAARDLPYEISYESVA